MQQYTLPTIYGSVRAKQIKHLSNACKTHCGEFKMAVVSWFKQTVKLLNIGCTSLYLWKNSFFLKLHHSDDVILLLTHSQFPLSPVITVNLCFHSIALWNKLIVYNRVQCSFKCASRQLTFPKEVKVFKFLKFKMTAQSVVVTAPVASTSRARTNPEPAVTVTCKLHNKKSWN